jgi:hypothetical protein
MKVTDVGAAYDPQFERVSDTEKVLRVFYKLRAAAQAALLALKCLDGLECAREEIEALEAALAEPAIKESLTAHRPWVGLTGDEIEDLPKDQTWWQIIRAAEEILKEKNT